MNITSTVEAAYKRQVIVVFDGLFICQSVRETQLFNKGIRTMVLVVIGGDWHVKNTSVRFEEGVWALWPHEQHGQLGRAEARFAMVLIEVLPY